VNFEFHVLLCLHHLVGKIPDRYYTGFTQNLDRRLSKHNSADDPHTAKYKPWRIKTAIAFNDRQKTLELERYLKSPSGRVFAKKRL
jgi:predicted GIY-YIG superfamily endonuclease